MLFTAYPAVCQRSAADRHVPPRCHTVPPAIFFSPWTRRLATCDCSQLCLCEHKTKQQALPPGLEASHGHCKILNHSFWNSKWKVPVIIWTYKHSTSRLNLWLLRISTWRCETRALCGRSFARLSSSPTHKGLWGRRLFHQHNILQRDRKPRRAMKYGTPRYTTDIWGIDCNGGDQHHDRWWIFQRFLSLITRLCSIVITTKWVICII